MNANELVNNAKGLVDKAKSKIEELKAVAADVKQHHAESKDFVSFCKVAVSKEILEKKERIPTVGITLWILFLLIFFKWDMIVVLGILPFIIYYAVQSVKAAPSG